jgi:sugar phosphate isomerase/epimerase
LAVSATLNSSPSSPRARLVGSTLIVRRQPLGAALAAIARAGLPAADIGALPGYCDHFDPRADDGEIARWAAEVRAAGLRIHTLNADIGAFNAPADSPEAVWARGRACLAAAAAVGARGVTFGPGLKVDRARQSLAGELARIAPWFRRLADCADASGLTISFEAPHRGGLIADAAEARALVEACAHPRVRLIFDVGHHLRAGWSLPAAVAAVGPWIEHVHLKDQADGQGRYPLGAGTVDFPALFAALEAAGYQGAYAFEFPDVADTAAAAEALLRASREFFERTFPATCPFSP